eukprot:1156593-Pelagomonas_calceolata.AAC.1
MGPASRGSCLPWTRMRHAVDVLGCVGCVLKSCAGARVVAGSSCVKWRLFFVQKSNNVEKCKLWNGGLGCLAATRAI